MDRSPDYSLCKNIRSDFSLDILTYMHDIAIPTKLKSHDVQIKAFSQIYDRSNRLQDISTQLTSNLFTSTVVSRCSGQWNPCFFLFVNVMKRICCVSVTW